MESNNETKKKKVVPIRPDLYSPKSLQRARWMRAPAPALRTMDSHLLVVSGVSTHHLMRKPRRIPWSGCVDTLSWSPNASTPTQPHEMVDDYKE